MVAVYDISNKSLPVFKQALPAELSPEGLLAIPSLNLLVAASELDSRATRVRSSLNICEYQIVHDNDGVDEGANSGEVQLINPGRILN